MEILDTKEQAKLYENIIKYASDFLIIVSPFFNEHEEQNFVNAVLQALKENKNLRKFLFIYRLKTKNDRWGISKKDFDEKILPTLKIMKENGVCVYTKHLEHLHAKAIMNQSRAMVGSLNITDCSIKNFELGVKIFNGKDATPEDIKCYNEALLIIASFYSKDAEEKLNTYRHNTRLGGGRYNVERNIGKLKEIDFEKCVFDETELEKL